MKYLTEEFIGEQVDCEDFGIGTIVEVTNRKVVLAFNDGLVDIELDDIELVEEVEDIDELSKKTLAKYIPAAAKDAVQAGHDAAVSGSDQDFKRGQNRHKGIETAVKKLTREEIELEEGRPRKVRTPEEQAEYDRKLANKKPGGGRGRPAVPGTEAHKRQQARMQAQKDAAAKGTTADISSERPVITAQLQKAKSIGAAVTFADGSSHKLEDGHIRKFEAHMDAARTPIQKAEIQSKADKDHKSWLELVNSPVQSHTGGTSQIVKYR